MMRTWQALVIAIGVAGVLALGALVSAFSDLGRYEDALRIRDVGEFGVQDLSVLTIALVAGAVVVGVLSAWVAMQRRAPRISAVLALFFIVGFPVGFAAVVRSFAATIRYDQYSDAPLSEPVLLWVIAGAALAGAAILVITSVAGKQRRGSTSSTRQGSTHYQSTKP